MYSVSRDFTLCYGHRLLNYSGKCAHLHGHNGTVRITLASETLNEQGMVLDFSDLKQSMGSWIEAHLDHRMVLDRRDPLVPLLEEQGEPLFLTDANPTAEHLARLIFMQAKTLGFPVRRVTFWETEKCSAEFSE